MNKNKIYQKNKTIITCNKRAYHDFFIIEEFEAGLVLQGWEVKSLHSGKVNISNNYVIIKNGEAFLFGTNFTPSIISSTHYLCNSTRIRKLLLNQYELNSLYGRIHIKGYTVIALSLYWKSSWCKAKIGVAKGKKEYDKRYILKKREWQLHKNNLTKV